MIIQNKNYNNKMYIFINSIIFSVCWFFYVFERSNLFDQNYSNIVK